MPLSEGLHLSLFHPYRALPPEGATLHPEEEACDPQERACKTPAHTYEARCGACSNTGWARGAGSASSGRRGNLHTCVVCHGLGYVRRTTARFCPDSPAHMTLARGGGGSPTFELPRLPTRGGTPEPRLQAAS